MHRAPDGTLGMQGRRRSRAPAWMPACLWLLMCAQGVRAAPPPSAPDAADELPAQAAGLEATPSVVLDELEATARERAAQMQRLREQLERLKKAAEQGSRLAPKGLQNPDDSAPPGSERSPPTPEPPPAEEHIVPQPHDSHPSAEVHHDAPAAEVPPAGRTRPVDEALPGTAIDRLALGDSLFATGQADLALQAYGSLELSRLRPADRYWVEYQMATCHRQLRNTDEAEKRYRRLAGLVDAGWCAACSRWWLDTLATRKTLEQNLTQIKQSLHGLEVQLDEQAKP